MCEHTCYIMYMLQVAAKLRNVANIKGTTNTMVAASIASAQQRLTYGLGSTKA